MLSLIYFPTNAAFSFVFHSGDPSTGTPISLDGYPRFFPTLDEGAYAAETRGLTVTRRGVRSIGPWDFAAATPAPAAAA